MFEKFEILRRLKNKMDECERSLNTVSDDHAGVENAEYIKAVIEYLKYGQEYYDDKNLSLVELNRLFELDSEFNTQKVADYYEEAEAIGDDSTGFENDEYNEAVIEYMRYGQELSETFGDVSELDSEFDTKKVVDYYEEDEVMAFIANTVFNDEHFGRALTDEEFAYRMQLAESYKDAIAFAKVIIQNNPHFEAMSEKQKINFVANILVSVKERMDAKKNDAEDFSPKF